MIYNEKCVGCGSTMTYDSTTDKKKDWHAWTKFHSNHGNPEPKVKGIGAQASTSSRPYSGYESYNGFGGAIPIINATALPFGFVPNERNEEWVK